MENSVLQKVKQPAPAVGIQTNDIDGKKYKIINNPNVGVVSTSKISTTPLVDLVEIKRKENPYIKYKIPTKNYKIKNIHTISLLTSIVCCILSLFKMKK